jgi:hypothetical protein
MLSADITEKIKRELDALDQEFVPVDGKYIKPSSCYYFGAHPAHILYNTNCPETLKAKINAILLKYIPDDESSTPQ